LSWINAPGSKGEILFLISVATEQLGADRRSGRLVAVHASVLDIAFAGRMLPAINDAPAIVIGEPADRRPALPPISGIDRSPSRRRRCSARQICRNTVSSRPPSPRVRVFDLDQYAHSLDVVF